MRKLLGISLSAVVLATTACFTATPAAAAPAAAALPPRANATTQELAQAIANLRSSGKSDSEVDAVLASEFGVVKPPQSKGSLLAPADRSTRSNSGDINVMKPSIYRNQYGAYIASASYQFNDTSALANDAGIFCLGSRSCDMGGLDAFGISLSRPVSSVQSYAMATSGDGSGYYTISNSRMSPTGGSTAGVIYKGQDQYHAAGARMDDYNFWNGTLVYEIRSIGCGELQAFSEYFHSWDDTTINGFSVGPWSLGVQWSSNDDKWERGSQASNAVRFC